MMFVKDSRKQRVRERQEQETRDKKQETDMEKNRREEDGDKKGERFHRTGQESTLYAEMG